MDTDNTTATDPVSADFSNSKTVKTTSGSQTAEVIVALIQFLFEVILPLLTGC